MIKNLMLYGLLGLSIFTTGYLVGHYREKSEFDAFVADVNAKGEIAKRNAENAVKTHEKLKEDYDKIFAERIALINANRVFYSRSGSDSLSTTSNATTSAFRPTSDDLPDAQRLAQDCSITTLQLITLQDWVLNPSRND